MTMASRLPALLLAAALALGGALLPSAVHAEPGDLARGFGQRGHRDLGRLYEPELERIDRGRIAVAGVLPNGAVSVRLVSANGDVVRSFGSRGARVLGKGVRHSRLNVAWSFKRNLIFVNAHFLDEGTEYARLWALNPDGSLARNFGDRGSVTHGPGFWNDIAAQNRKLLVLGQSNVARLRGDGLTFDPTFNGGAGSTAFPAPGLVLQEIEPMLPGFYVTGASQEGLEVYRLFDGGGIDTSWADSGNSTWTPQAPAGYTVTGYTGGLADVRDKEQALVYTGTIRATSPDSPGTTSRFEVVGALLPTGYLDTDGFGNGIHRGYRAGGAPVSIRRERVLVPGSVATKRGRTASITRLTPYGRPDPGFGVRGSYRDARTSAYDTVAMLPSRRGLIVGVQLHRSKRAGFRTVLVGVRG